MAHDFCFCLEKKKRANWFLKLYLPLRFLRARNVVCRYIIRLGHARYEFRAAAGFVRMILSSLLCCPLSQFVPGDPNNSPREPAFLFSFWRAYLCVLGLFVFCVRTRFPPTECRCFDIFSEGRTLLRVPIIIILIKSKKRNRECCQRKWLGINLHFQKSDSALGHTYAQEMEKKKRLAVENLKEHKFI